MQLWYDSWLVEMIFLHPNFNFHWNKNNSHQDALTFVGVIWEEQDLWTRASPHHCSTSLQSCFVTHLTCVKRNADSCGLDTALSHIAISRFGLYFDLLCGPTAKDKCTCHCILQLLGHFRDLKQSFKGEIRYVRISQLSNSYSKPIEGSMSPEYCR